LFFDKQFTIQVNDVNEAPNEILLSNNTVVENAGTNAAIGTLSATDPDTTPQTLTFTLAAGLGDNAAFNIAPDGVTLRANASIDFERQSVYQLIVRDTDQICLHFDKQFTIQVTDVNEAPTDIALTNNSLPENAGTNAAIGTLSATDPDTTPQNFTFTL